VTALARVAANSHDDSRSAPARAGIFVLGAVLVVLGGAAWLLSVLLTLPFMFAGLWVWSREFGWAHRMLDRFLGWSRSVWRRARAHPVRWGVSTTLSLAITGVVYWWWMG
jgi:uncharacterized membrane protein YbaN (DUF454 family)